MKLCSIAIRNYKSVRSLQINDVDNAVILVGRNSTGKTVIINALLVAAGLYPLSASDFTEPSRNMEVMIDFEYTEDDLHMLNQKGLVSKYKRFTTWREDFCSKLPSFHNHHLTFTFIANRDGTMRYDDGVKKHNPYILQIFPKLHHIDTSRNVHEIQEDILLLQEQEALTSLRDNSCMFDFSKPCHSCYQCLGVIEKKNPMELTLAESVKLLEYKMLHLNLDSFIERLNQYFHKNSNTQQDIKFVMDFNIDELFKTNALLINNAHSTEGLLQEMSAGMKSIYIFSLLEAYIEESNRIPSILLIEDPEIFLHPQLQKVASEILYRLSKKNQVMFTTHSPNLIYNFNSRQIKQVSLDEDYFTTVREHADIDEILDDLGVTANDFMNVSFVFIVEGKQDSSRLPLLLNKYYSEVYDDTGALQRIAIIPTNSCTNIKTYANLKYINKLYLKDQFLMIRDGDGKDHDLLVNQLCNYYLEREHTDRGNLPRVTDRNVLVLKYYSFENYFLDPRVMTQIGVISSEDEFYDTLFRNYKKYLYKITSIKRLREEFGITIDCPADVKQHLEMLRIYGRGHNLYDMFYGPFKGEAETEILKRYIEAAPRENWKDILERIDRFVYFDSRRK